jgi:hypothetical protein
MFPVPADESPQGIHWPTKIGGSCDGGMLRIYLPSLHPNVAARKLQQWPAKTAAELDTLRQWRDVKFTGASITDFMAFASAIKAIKTVQADAGCKSGVRIHFQPHATFNSLVATLNVLDIFGQQDYCYWLAWRNEPLTIYYIALKAS